MKAELIFITKLVARVTDVKIYCASNRWPIHFGGVRKFVSACLCKVQIFASIEINGKSRLDSTLE